MGGKKKYINIFSSFTEPFNYVVYKNLAPDATIKLVKAMFVQVACDWLDSLEDGKKDTCEHLKDAFAERFFQTSILRFKNTKEIFWQQTRHG